MVVKLDPEVSKLKAEVQRMSREVFNLKRSLDILEGKGKRTNKKTQKALKRFGSFVESMINKFNL